MLNIFRRMKKNENCYLGINLLLELLFFYEKKNNLKNCILK